MTQKATAPDLRGAYRDGLKDMAAWLGVWRNGVQLVGVRSQTLREVEAEIDAGKWDSGRVPR